MKERLKKSAHERAFPSTVKLHLSLYREIALLLKKLYAWKGIYFYQFGCGEKNSAGVTLKVLSFWSYIILTRFCFGAFFSIRDASLL